MSDEQAVPGDELRRRFLEAAREVLREPDTSLDLRKVAERAGKSRTAPYLAFGRTEEGGGLSGLQLAVAAEGFTELGKRMDRALGRSRDPEEGLRGMAAAYLAFARDEPRLFRLMFGPDVADALGERVPEGPGRRERERLTRARELTEITFLEAIGMEQGGYLRRQGPLPPEDLAGAVWALLHGVAMLTIDGQWGTTRLGVLDDPEELAASTLRFLTTTSSEEIRPAREALETAKREKGLREDWSRMDMLREEPPEGFKSYARSMAKAAIPPDPPPALARRVQRSEPEVPSSLRRARDHAHLVRGARILWVDDVPERSASEAEIFRALGADIDRARTTDAALAALSRYSFDVIVSDIARGEAPDEGVRALPRLLERAGGAPVIFYVQRLRTGTASPEGAFGITNDPEELVHLVFDALERRR